MRVNSLPKTVTRQRRECDLNPGPSAPESSTLSTRLSSHPTGSSKLDSSCLYLCEVQVEKLFVRHIQSR